MAGQGASYRPAYCQQVLAVMGEGLSLTGFAGEIGASRATLERWIELHPEFAEAVAVGQAKRTAFLERGLLESGQNATARILALKNAAPEEWRDRQPSKDEGEAAQAPMQELTIRFVDPCRDDEPSEP